MNENNKLQEAAETVFEALRTDESYRIAWKANIAMAFVDNSDWYKKRKNKKSLSRRDIWEIANLAADYFLGQLTEERRPMGTK